MLQTSAGRIESKRRPGLLRTLSKYKFLYAMMVPGILFFIIFHYLPMYGLVIAFQNYIPSRGVQGMFQDPIWIGLANFQQFFGSYYFGRTLTNTLLIFFYKFITGFPAAIILALLINELQSKAFKRTVQTISYLPHFLSMVTVTSIVITLLNPTNGVVNQVRESLGYGRINFLSTPRYFRSILVVMNLWKTVGWSSIIYLAAISGVDPQLYECARIEGASKLQQIRHITLPSIAFIISIQLILNVGNLLSAGFEDILLLYNPMVYQVADVIDTFVYREGLVNSNFSYSTAVGLFKNIVGMVLVLGTNAVVKKIGHEGIW